MERLTTKRTDGRWALVRHKGERPLDNIPRAIDRLAAYEDAEEHGLLVRLDESMALAMLAGARAIGQNPRKYLGTTFVVFDCFGENPKEITYHDAARKLRKVAEAALAKEE